ncbi:MAG: hypothetical protein P8P74_18875 [Crocinitomicaceae bacterium]|nr:hypothetical protein [Crocinitomicaceae bacterium]
MKVNILLGIFFVFATLISNATPIASFDAISPINVEPTEEWQEYATVDDVRIEYKRKKCSPGTEREQNLILFRYTNLSNDVKTVSWIVKIWRNDYCVNCNAIANPEYGHTITLQPNEALEADGTTKTDKRIYIFDNFIKLVPGMQEQRLTNFELFDLNVE